MGANFSAPDDSALVDNYLLIKNDLDCGRFSSISASKLFLF